VRISTRYGSVRAPSVAISNTSGSSRGPARRSSSTCASKMSNTPCPSPLCCSPNWPLPLSPVARVPKILKRPVYIQPLVCGMRQNSRCRSGGSVLEGRILLRTRPGGPPSHEGRLGGIDHRLALARSAVGAALCRRVISGKRSARQLRSRLRHVQRRGATRFDALLFLGPGAREFVGPWMAARRAGQDALAEATGRIPETTDRSAAPEIRGDVQNRYVIVPLTVRPLSARAVPAPSDSV